ncbi:MAG: isopeptide-forming domain-containing fimbrial protein [Clostridium sp.]
MPSNPLSMTIANTQNLPILVGNTSSFDISIKNLSSIQRFYNLTLFLTLPDGMTLSSATLTQTTSITNADNSITYSWINIKDLAPMEINYKFTITVKCGTKFKNGTVIPFGYTFSSVSVSCQVDTMPRGSYDALNQVITQQIYMSYVTTRFSSSITTSSKVLKGAGTSISLNDYTQVNTATCKFYNNSTSTSLVNISILLQDGIRYIGNITTSGTDASNLLSPIITLVSINNVIYTQLYFGNISLSINSNTTLIFSYAVFNRYNNNLGALIVHGTNLNIAINMTSADQLITSSFNSNFTFSAMDLIITASINSQIVDVQNNVTYSYVYRVGQYYTIKDIVVHYLLPDGILYISSSSNPTSVVNNSTHNGYYLTYNFTQANPNSTKTVTISSKINSYYYYKFDSEFVNLPIVASDPFLAATDILGTLVENLTQVTDSSNVSSSINIGTITKQFIKGYYKNGTAKTINALAPGDLAEYKLSYSASTLKAIQKQVYIDDFFPLAATPIDTLTYIYTGVVPVTSPSLISPHGVDFNYGDIPGLSTATINFKVAIASLGGSGQNSNLMKLKGINTYGTAYSNRTQVNVNIGSPNLTLTKTVAGPNKNAIQANEIYTYTVTLSNSSNLGTETDAFDFTLTDTLTPSWSTINSSSIQITGSAIYDSPIVQSDSIIINIHKLSPGSSITLNYNVTISAILSPGVTITTTASNTNPYSQVYNASDSNFQYTNLNKSASVSLSSLAITLSKTNVANVLKVGYPVSYILTATIPQGTIAYNLYIKDTLPSGGQTYLGPSYKNDIQTNPTISSNIITFATESIVDARSSIQILTYTTVAKISNATKILNTTTSTQTNTMQCLYQKVQNASYTTITKTLLLTINHPNIVMNLSAKDKTNSTIYSSNATINTNSIMQFTLMFQNNSAIKLVNGTIEIPLNNNFIFSSIDNSSLCTATFNSTLKKLVISIPQLDSLYSGYITFTVLPQSTLRAGTSIPTQATAISYYNDISSTKVYGGETSNVLTSILPAGVLLKPNPIYQINDTTQFIVTAPGDTATIIDYFTNIGGGYDDFTLTIQPVAIPYSLYIDDVKVADIQSNTLYQGNLPSMTNLSPGTNKTIKLLASIPLSGSLGVRYDFIVTAASKTSPYPQSTVLNIDPDPF